MFKIGFCRDGPPKLPNAQPTTMSADSVIFKCLKGYAFATGSVFVRINCDDSNKAWKGPFPNCEPKGDLTVLVLYNVNKVCIHQPFSRTFFAFISKIYKFECNTTSDWLNRMV